MPVPQPKRVTVWWDDAHASEKNVDHSEAVNKYHRPYPTATVGWLVKSDKTGVTVAKNWNPPNGGFEPWDYRDLHFVPRGVIRKVEELCPSRKVPAARPSPRTSAPRSRRASRNVRPSRSR